MKAAPKRARVRTKELPVKDPQTPLPDGVPFQATAVPAATRKINVTFLFPEPDAKQVFVCGSFNDWAPEEIKLTRNAEGCWAASVALPAGRHEYKFVVDGKWMPDLGAAEHVPNEFGSLNSVIEVRL